MCEMIHSLISILPCKASETLEFKKSSKSILSRILMSSDYMKQQKKATCKAKVILLAGWTRRAREDRVQSVAGTTGGG
jgi:hypothetical protein